MDLLIASGVTEVALGAVLGFPYALAVDKQPWGQWILSALRVNHPKRLRQLHLDLIIMGGLLIAVGAALPELPGWIAVLVGVGGWTNPLLFAPLMVDEGHQQRLWYRGASVASFVITTVGWVAVATHAIHVVVAS